MSERSSRRSRVVELRVLRTERRTPGMIRVVLGGPGIADFQDNGESDRYVKLLFPPNGVSYPEPFDLDAITANYPAELCPVKRTYTVRSFDAERGELTVDFVYHGDTGFAGPWAANAQPGDILRLLGPGGKYHPSTEANWHLLVGDETAIPAIGASLEQLPPDARAHVILQVANPDEKQAFDSPASVDITWLFRNEATTAAPRTELIEAVRAFTFPAGQGHFFVHGEAETVMKGIRPYLLHTREVHRDWLSISGYWRCGSNEEKFREWKKREAAIA